MARSFENVSESESLEKSLAEAIFKEKNGEKKFWQLENA